jgi:asparagine synthase (glutamine-hydrolysing)
MNAMMVHRGPDDDGTFVDPCGVALGARRLSVIDVADGHQPVSNEDRTIWAILNGEIYNHPELFEQLRRGRHTLSSRTDTEVLVHLYEDHGDALVDELEGMYAFAIWDARRRRLLVARDRFGEKPLFYRASGGQVVFASELTALRRGLTNSADELDPSSLAAFLALGYVPNPRSLLRDIHQLPPAHVLTWSSERPEAQIARYWRLPGAPAAAPARPPIDELDAALDRSIRSRLVADVPVGVMLSGGVDSSLVAAYAARASERRIRTFTVGYDVGGVNETGPARHVAGILGSEHREIVLTQDEVGGRVPLLLAALDQPIADPAIVALHCVSRFARQHVTVAVGGEGADELFAGYPRYRWLARSVRLAGALPAPLLAAGAGALRRAPLRGRSARLADVLQPGGDVDRHLRWVTDGRVHQMRSLWGPALHDANPSFHAAADAREIIGRSGTATTMRRFMALDQERWLPDDVLAKADRASMLVSLEMRTPFLDRGLAELAASIPDDVQAGRHGKQLLRALLRRALPELAATPRKTAFRVPQAAWLRGPLRPFVEAQLSHGSAFSEGWLDREAVARLVDEHNHGRADWSGHLWTVMAFGAWLDGVRGSSP